jgi:Transposase DDE domain group 1
MPLRARRIGFLKDPFATGTKGISQMQLSHGRPVASACFDDPNLVASAGLVPVMKLADDAGLRRLADEQLTVPTDKGANAGLKLASLVGGMVAGADSIDDMAVLRHGGMDRVFDACYAPSTLGSFLRAFTFGHVRQLDAVASRVLANLTASTPLLDGIDADVLVDVDDTIIEVHGHAKQGAGFGYSGVRGLNALLGTVTVVGQAPVIVAQRLRKGSTSSPRGAARLVADTLAAVARLRRRAGAGAPGRVLLRADSAFYASTVITTAVAAGAEVSVTVRLDKRVKAAIAAVAEDAWVTIQYTDAVFDEQAERWISVAEVAEIPYLAFASKKKSEQVTGRLVVRRIPDLDPKAAPGQASLFQAWRFHAFFTTTPPGTADTVVADKTHRHHAIIENVNADLKSSALAHMPSGSFSANGAWLVCAVLAFNLTRAAATIAGGNLTRAATPTIRRTLINIPARVACSARRLRLHLPQRWPWQHAWTKLFTRAYRPPAGTTTT